MKQIHYATPPRRKPARFLRDVENSRYDRAPCTSDQYDELVFLGYSGSGYLTIWEAERLLELYRAGRGARYR